MRILILADAQSSHTHKWVIGLSEKGFDVHLFSLSNPPMNWYNNNIKIYSLGLKEKIKYESEKSINKLKYLKAITQIRTIIRSINPDILHSHYASSYGFLGSVTKFHPFILSIWGSDIESFPHKSFIHKTLIKRTLNSADKVMATSSYLAERANEILKRDITIIPFGVDIEIFKPDESKNIYHNEIVIGTIKSLEEVYGIDVLIQAFSLVKKNISGIPLKLLIVGGGSREMELKKIASSLLNQEGYLFQGYIDHNLIPDYHNKIDIPVYLSRKESFGVSVIESMSCGKPVIATGIGGLSEIISDGVEGILVQPDDIVSAAEAIEKLVLNSDLRDYLGQNGKKKVHKYYNWEDNLNSMISIYYDLNNGKK
jgi:L-malate glycosyltransferase